MSAGGVLGVGLKNGGFLLGQVEIFLALGVEFAGEVLDLPGGGVAVGGDDVELAVKFGSFGRGLPGGLLRGVALVFEFGDLVFGTAEAVVQFEDLGVGAVARLANGEKLPLGFRDEASLIFAAAVEGLQLAGSFFALP